jgi:TRAP-type mannitol/chloroaromatic compound transport system permease large subunit
VRLLSAELLAMRKRAATYVVLAVLLAIMAIVYLLVGYTTSATGTGGFAGGVLTFPDAYAVVVQFVFGLGSLLAVIYAVVTEQSIGALLLGGIGPGLVYAGCLLLGVYLIALLTPQHMPITCNDGQFSCSLIPSGFSATTQNRLSCRPWPRSASGRRRTSSAASCRTRSSRPRSSPIGS